MSGSQLGRCFAAKMRAMAALSSASAPRPYTVSVGKATMPDLRSSVAARWIWTRCGKSGLILTMLLIFAASVSQPVALFKLLPDGKDRTLRAMPSERANTVLVVGGTGYFGRLLVEDLLKHVPGRLIIGCRRRSLHDPWGGRAEIQTMDLLRPETYASMLGQVRAAICAAGPFQSMPVSFARACIEHQVDYIDLADDRGFVKRVRSLTTPQMTAVCTGWSAVPALSGALARIASEGAGKVDEMFIQIAPGNRVPRANSTVASLLASVGKPFTIWNDGRWENVTGWSRPRRFAFPAPVGNRTGFVVDVPDHEFFPEMFEANRVEFRVGAELGMLNRAVTLLAWISGKGIVRDWSRWARVVRT